MDRLQILRPRLPTADQLLPYLRLIDASRTYSNHGQLVRKLELRLSGCLGLPAAGIVSASSGTSAIIGAVLAAAGRADDKRPLAVIPAFTFVATAAAVEQCGYQPYLVDVDANSWMLEPDRLAEHALLDRIGVVVPVAPFGRAVAQEPWLTFRRRTNIPVVIDGSASFDTVVRAPAPYTGEIPVAFSFHATKSFGAGEGGAVATGDADLATRVMRALNFGFHPTRDSQSASTNGKMSEYHAAVGLAELDGWAEKLSAFQTVADCYRRLLAEAGLADRLYAPPEIGASYILFRCLGAEPLAVQKSLRESGIDFRLWYGTGLHRQTYFADLPHDGLSVTDEIAPRLLGLPVAPDLSEASVHRVCGALRKGVGID